jgi:hypothetical protein
MRAMLGHYPAPALACAVLVGLFCLFVYAAWREIRSGASRDQQEAARLPLEDA